MRDLLDADINVLAQLVEKMEKKGDTHYSLSCNLDLRNMILLSLARRTVL